ncbi:MAG: bifunctional 4-hydroxy-3-methylbut-2-enyl diphosphate reductase/30S ribosomal protein S1 [Tissierellia bacterium]|mgnify:CR=1 FL=1|nr:bifunctional 4-hydroxy-3-methylbut-2-enyl diphosphate reductase/30S ribosomal protein S1 [Tissierellia bacterium]
MEIILADKAGFCYGVKRAVEMTEKELSNTKEKVYSLGPLIHNPQAVKEFEEKGLMVIDEISEIRDSKVIIRSHGVSKEIVDKMKEQNIDIVDSTCPYVKSVHNKVEEYHKQGYNIVIVGDKNHPEIIGINGWCNNKAFIINSEEEALNLPKMDKVCVVSQTTNTQEKFARLSEIVKEKGNEVKIFNTICNATNHRQEACREVAKKVDAMIVIGGYHSSNTKKLADISKKYCKHVYHIETKDELPLDEIQKFNKIGITAGASTPDWIIKEVIETMENLSNNDNLSNSEMMEVIESSFTKIHRGDVVKGKVIFVTDDEVMVNINYKADGIITRDELSNDPDIKPRDLFNQGDEIDVYVVKLDDGEGNVVLSTKRIEEIKNWDIVENFYKEKERVECKVLNVVKGGLSVLVHGINGFMPASQISLKYVSDLNPYKGKTLIAKIIDFDRSRRRVILSRKEVEREELNNRRKELWASLEVDQIREGVVQRLTDFGAFVDLGGVDGLIHISDLSWNRIKHPSEVVTEGQKVNVKVLAFDREKNRISLGLKQTMEEPWIAFSKNVNIGDIVEGTVVNLLDFGAFVRLKEGVDGLLHVSQISKDHVNKPSDVLSIGDKIKVKVIDINGDEKKISLSLKEAKEAEEKENEASQLNNLKEEVEFTIEDMVEKN